MLSNNNLDFSGIIFTIASYSPEYITPTQKNQDHVSRPRPHGIYLPHENFSLFIIFEK
jgi:hypothetical protein